MASLRWIDKPISEGGVTEYRFDLERETGIVPGMLWTPTQQDRPVPLVMMGHGGSGHKRADRQLMLGQRFAGVSQMAAVAIDGPFHGDRVPEQLDRRQQFPVKSLRQICWTNGTVERCPCHSL